MPLFSVVVLELKLLAPSVIRNQASGRDIHRNDFLITYCWLLLLLISGTWFTMKKTLALIFDLNGTMINDMDYHINAWYKIVNDLGAVFLCNIWRKNAMAKMKKCWSGFFPADFQKAKKPKWAWKKNSSISRCINQT